MGDVQVDLGHMIVSGGITLQNVRDFNEQCADLEGPVLLYCRSGARSAMLWQLAQQYRG